MSGEFTLRYLLYDTYDEILTIVHTILLAIVRFVSCVYNFGICKVIKTNIMFLRSLLRIPKTRFANEKENVCYNTIVRYLR